MSAPAETLATPGREDLISIGAAAALSGVSERALRYYQELGLITPCGRTPGGLRRYSEEDLARVARIRELQTLLGLNLDEIAVVLRNDDRLAEIKAVVPRRAHGRRGAGGPGSRVPCTAGATPGYRRGQAGGAGHLSDRPGRPYSARPGSTAGRITSARPAYERHVIGDNLLKVRLHVAD